MTPLTAQVTSWWIVPDTVALNCWLCLTGTLANAGDTETEIGSATSDIGALAIADRRAALFAITATVPDGMVGGAVYNPDDEIVPMVEFPPTTPSTVQITRVSLVPDTEAMNCCDRRTCTRE